MSTDAFQTLDTAVKQLKAKVDAVFRPDRYLFDRDVEIMRGKKLRGAYYAGTSSLPPTGWTVSLGAGGSAGQNTVTHNLGTSNYAVLVTVIGSTNEAFEVGVANITSTAFNVYTSNGTSLVARAFSFMVIPL